jgi:ABC-type uncharacterized transport system permease subunit
MIAGFVVGLFTHAKGDLLGYFIFFGLLLGIIVGVITGVLFCMHALKEKS